MSYASLPAKTPAHRTRSLRLFLVAFAVLFGVVSLTACTNVGRSQSTYAGESGKFPAVTGTAYGETPTIAKGVGDAPTQLQKKILTEGDGATITADDQILINYLGQLWDGTAINSTFKLGGSPQAFKLSELMKGWQHGLVGVKEGSRVLLVVPPSEGFEEGDRVKVPEGATQVYVIDVVSRASLTDTSALSPSNSTKIQENFDKLPKWLTIGGDISGKPTIKIAENAPAVTEAQTLMLYQGKGASLQATDFPIVHVTTVNYEDGKWGTVTSTWDSGWMQSTPTPVSTTEWFLGVPVGSRMVVLQGAEEARQGGVSAHPARIVIYDIAARQVTQTGS